MKQEIKLDQFSSFDPVIRSSHWRHLTAFINSLGVHNKIIIMDNKTPVSLLQELLVKKQLAPIYNIILNGTGTHDPLFKYEVAACGESAIGSGKSKKEAKHEAARLLLDKLFEERPVERLNVNINSPYAEVIRNNAVGILAEYCWEKNLPIPKYDLIRDEGLPHAKLFSFKCCVSSFITEGQARTKKQAKQLSAQQMLNKLKEYIQNMRPIQKMDKAEFKKSNEIIIKKLMEMRLEKSNATDQYGIRINNYYKTFLNACKSHLLQAIKGQNRIFFEKMVDPESVCMSILKELNFQYKIEEVPTITRTVGIVLTIKGASTWKFFCCEPNANETIREVFIEALSFMADVIDE